MLRWLVIAVAQAQLVVDWTAHATNGDKALCALYSTVAFHRTCVTNKVQERWLTPKDCHHLVRFDELPDDGIGKKAAKAIHAWKHCDLNRSVPVSMTSDGLHALTTVECISGLYASSDLAGCKAGMRRQVLPSAEFFRLAGFCDSDGSIDIYDGAGASFFNEVLIALPGVASDRTLCPQDKPLTVWVSDPMARWLGDCTSAGSTTQACDDLARALGSRVAAFREKASRAGPSRRRLAVVVNQITHAFRAEDLEREWPRYAKLFPNITTSRRRRPGGGHARNIALPERRAINSGLPRGRRAALPIGEEFTKRLPEGRLRRVTRVGEAGPAPR